MPIGKNVQLGSKVRLFHPDQSIRGLFFFWDTLTLCGDRKERRTRWVIGVNLALFAMTHWLLSMDGNTPPTLLVLGCSMVAAQCEPVKAVPLFSRS
jgi:hypothetical protein